MTGKRWQQLKRPFVSGSCRGHHQTRTLQRKISRAHLPSCSLHGRGPFTASPGTSRGTMRGRQMESPRPHPISLCLFSRKRGCRWLRFYKAMQAPSQLQVILRSWVRVTGDTELSQKPKGRDCKAGVHRDPWTDLDRGQEVTLGHGQTGEERCLKYATLSVRATAQL